MQCHYKNVISVSIRYAPCWHHNVHRARPTQWSTVQVQVAAWSCRIQVDPGKRGGGVPSKETKKPHPLPSSKLKNLTRLDQLGLCPWALKCWVSKNESTYECKEGTSIYSAPFFSKHSHPFSFGGAPHLPPLLFSWNNLHPCLMGRGGRRGSYFLWVLKRIVIALLRLLDWHSMCYYSSTVFSRGKEGGVLDLEREPVKEEKVEGLQDWNRWQLCPSTTPTCACAHTPHSPCQAYRLYWLYQKLCFLAPCKGRWLQEKSLRRRATATVLFNNKLQQEKGKIILLTAAKQCVWVREDKMLTGSS